MPPIAASDIPDWPNWPTTCLKCWKGSEESAILANQIDKFEREAIMETGTIVTVLYISCIIALVAAAVLDWVSTRRPDDSPWE